MKRSNKMKQGKIVEFVGTWCSGIAHLHIESDGIIIPVPCDNAPTVRALEGFFGNVIGPGHIVKKDGGHVGEEIMYETESGILSVIIPLNSVYIKP
jgi:hypothetical protein